MYVVAALYKFVRLPDYVTLRDELYNTMVANKVKGTLLLAEEGINGTMCGLREGVDAVKAWLDADGRFDGMSYKESLSDELAFYRTKVKLKKEIESSVKKCFIDDHGNHTCANHTRNIGYNLISKSQRV